MVHNPLFISTQPKFHNSRFQLCNMISDCCLTPSGYYPRHQTLLLVFFTLVSTFESCVEYKCFTLPDFVQDSTSHPPDIFKSLQSTASICGVRQKGTEWKSGITLVDFMESKVFTHCFDVLSHNFFSLSLLLPFLSQVVTSSHPPTLCLTLK